MPDVSLTSTSTGYLSGSISWTGLSSGIDFGEVIDQLVYIEEAHSRSLEEWKATWEDKITSLQGLNSRMAALEEFCNELNAFNEFYSRTSATSDSTVLTVSNTSSAVPGSHSVTVGQDIQGRVASQSFQDDAALGGSGGEIKIHVGDPDDSGTWQTITLTEGVDWTYDNAAHDIDFLAALIDAADTAGPDCFEDVLVIEDKDRDGTIYKRLIITAEEGGTANQVWIEQPQGITLFYENTEIVGPIATDFGEEILTSIDDPVETSIEDPVETSWTSEVSMASGGTYAGETGKTFSFWVATAGLIGTDDVVIGWNDGEGHGGTIDISDYGVYEVYEGLTVEFVDNGDDQVFDSETFTIDVNQDWTSEVDLAKGGQYTGTTDKTFTFTVTTAGVIGTDDIVIHWDDGDGHSGDINVLASSGYGVYDVYEGVQIELADSGDDEVFLDETFTMDANHNWSSAVGLAQEGTYTGEEDKTFTFTVTTAGVIGTDDVVIHWDDGDGHSGDINIPASAGYGTYYVYEGLSLTLEDNGDDEVFLDDSFTIDAYYSWTGEVGLQKGGIYTGDTDKTFTFTVTTAGEIGTDDVVIHWDDGDGHSGDINVLADTGFGVYDVYEGVKVEFVDLGDGEVFLDEAFTMDVSVTDRKTAIDDPLYEANWNSDITLESSGTYTGSTNKTFTFMVYNSAEVGQEDVTVRWADNEGNSGSFVVDHFGVYDVFQGVQVEFIDSGADDTLKAADSFTIDVYHSTYQAAQDKGLAQVEQRVHGGYIDLITPVTDQDELFSYTYEGVTTTIEVEAGTKLGNLVDLINADPNNRGVTASIINDGTSSTTAYHLVLTGKHTGAEHTITDISGTLDNFDCTDSDFETTQQAANSMIKVDGYPSPSYDYIQRSSNSISDVLTGVSLGLKDAGSAVVTVANDMNTIKTKIETFVSSINFVMDYIAEETKYDSETGESGVMIGNYAYSLVRSIIANQLYPSGLDSDLDVYSNLSQIGITTDPDQDGKWVIDSDLLDAALNSDLEAVARLFVADTDNDSQGVCALLIEKLEELNDSEEGIAYVLIDNYNGIVSDIDDKIASEEKRIALYEQRLEERFARLEAVLSELNSELSYLETQLDQLPTIGD